MDTKAWR